MIIRFKLTSVLLLCGVTATAAQEPQRCQWQALAQPTDKEFMHQPIKLPQFLTGKSIGKIKVMRYNVFSDDHNVPLNGLYQWLNNIHTITAENIILQDLSFTHHDRFAPIEIKESERLLRNRKYIYDARITPVSLCDDRVDIDISTRDNWSLTPSFNISHNGNETKTRLALTDSNFLGSGKLIAVSRASNAQRVGYSLRYRDPNVGGTHLLNEIEYSDNSDGYKHFIRVTKPFYSINSQWSYGASYTNQLSNEPIFTQQIKFAELTHQRNYYTAFIGHAKDYSDNTTTRWHYGFNVEKDLWSSSSPLIPQELLADTTNIYPWIQWSFLEDNYTTLTNFNTIKRTEDINLGFNIDIRVGYSSHQWTRDLSRFIYHVTAQDTIKKEDQLLVLSADVNGYWLSNRSQINNMSGIAQARYYNFITPNWVFFSGLTYHFRHSPTLDNQLFLGGESGLRGYPVRYRMANKTIVSTIEQRFYSDLYWWKLIRVGAAAFIDIGKHWGDSEHTLWRNNKDNHWLANIGIGLRLAPSHADSDHVIHLDWAFPLLDKTDVTDSRFMITVKKSF